MDGRRPDADEMVRKARDTFVNKRHLSMGSVGPFLMMINGRYRTFEFHGVCGPVLLNAAGDPLDRQPAESSPFWGAFDRWAKSGCHVDQFNRAYVPSERVLTPTQPNEE